MKGDFASRFWARVDMSGGPDACWLWLGCRHKDGHGQVRANGRVEYAHRVAFVLEKGPLADGAVVLHGCDNPPCCNPGHLADGSQPDNVADMVKKGRAWYQNPRFAPKALSLPLLDEVPA